jgi:hypothetical protein
MGLPQILQPHLTTKLVLRASPPRIEAQKNLLMQGLPGRSSFAHSEAGLLNVLRKEEWLIGET